MYFLINKLKKNKRTNKTRAYRNHLLGRPYTQYVLFRQFFLLFKINITRPCILD